MIYLLYHHHYIYYIKNVLKKNDFVSNLNIKSTWKVSTTHNKGIIKLSKRIYTFKLIFNPWDIKVPKLEETYLLKYPTRAKVNNQDSLN